MMAISAFKSALNYTRTYVVLIKDFAAFVGPKMTLLITGVITGALLYPIPYFWIASAVFAMMGGKDHSSLKIGQWHVQMPVDNAFLLGLALAAATETYRYLTARACITATTDWQTSLLWRAVNRLPVMARWDTETLIPLPLKEERLGSFLTSLVRSAFLVGRIVGLGVPNFVIALGALLILVWLDPVSVAVLIAVALPCLPIYAWAVLGMLSLRRQSTQERPREQALLKEIVRRIIEKPGRQVDSRQLAPEAEGRFASGYGVVNAQLQSLNLVNLIVGLHVVLSVAVIYVLNGASLSHFVREKIIFFVVLLFMMRSMIALVTLLARLSRGYGGVAGLRAYLHPTKKRVCSGFGAPRSAMFALEDNGSGTHHFLVPGEPAFVVMPNATRAFELMPLSNGLEVIRMMPDEVLNHIIFIDLPELQDLNDTDTQAVQRSSIEVADRKQTLRFPLRQEKFGHRELGVVAISRTAWDYLVSTNAQEDFCRDRTVFIVLADMQRPTPPSPNTLLIISDCEEIIAVGPFDETWERVESAFERARSKTLKVDFGDDEVLE